MRILLSFGYSWCLHICVNSLPLSTSSFELLALSPYCMSRFGPRFPAMTVAYDKDLRKLAWETALELDMAEFTRKGVYMCISGPSYETPTESRLARMLGADAIGMSTAPETVVARHCGLRVLGGWVGSQGAGVCVCVCPCTCVHVCIHLQVCPLSRTWSSWRQTRMMLMRLPTRR